MNASSFWNGNHELSEEQERLAKDYMPPMGAAETLEAELFRASNRLLYDYFCNGWCNNKTAELEFLKAYGFFTSLTVENLVEETPLYGREWVEEHLDSEHARVIENLLENENDQTEIDFDFMDHYGLGIADYNRLVDEMSDSEEEDDYDW